MNLFQKINFISHAGKPLDWKLECDALTDEDWECIAYLISKRIKFHKVIGVPEGGLKLQSALKKYISKGANLLLIVDDVMTSGSSMQECLHNNPMDKVMGVVLFAREDYPSWVIPLFQMDNYWWNEERWNTPRKVDEKNIIPEMTDPLGKYWDQPSRSDITIDDKYARMNWSSFDKLHEYNCSQPSGVYEGKMWKSKDSDRWLLRWFGVNFSDQTCCSNNTRIISIVE